MLSNSQFQLQSQVQLQSHVQLGPITLNSVSSSSDISTIFIIGFPDDFKERELINMFLFAPGFEGAVLKTTTITSFLQSTFLPLMDETNSNRKQLIGFVKFSKPVEAAYALEILNGKILDQEKGLVLKAEIAKKNLFIKPNGSVVSISKSLRGSASGNVSPSSISDDESMLLGLCTCMSSSSSSSSSTCSNQACPLKPTPISQSQQRMMSITLPGQSDPSIICAPEMEPVKLEIPTIIKPTSPFLQSNPSTPVPLTPIMSSKSQTPQLQPQQQQILMVPDRVLDISSLQRNLIASPNLGSMAAIVGENFPCNTLYVGNLPPSAQEEELRALFRNCLGYRRLSFRPKSSGPMCFVEFEDIACATAAMETLYGTMISCSIPSKGGIRLSFSKNPLGLRVASPSPVTQNLSSLTTISAISTPTAISNSNSFMEAIGAETDNPDHRQAIATIFAHYYKINPHKSVEVTRFT